MISAFVSDKNWINGKIRKGKYNEFQKRLIILEANKYPFFGEIGLLESDIRSATVRAIKDTKTMVINKEQFLALADNEPEMGYKVLRAVSKMICSRLRKSSNDITKLTTALSIALSK